MAVNVGTDSYVTLAEAEDYFDGKLHTSEWDNAGETTKEKALKEACRRINRLTFKGEKYEEDQVLAFPRVFPVFNRVGVIGFNYAEDEDGYPVVPDEVKAAQCEEALALLKYGNSARTKAQEQNVIRVSFGNVSEEYRAGLKLLSKEALELLKPYLAGVIAIK